MDGSQRLIERQESVYSWTFLYLGANQDAIEEGAKLGVDRSRSMTYSGAVADSAYASTATLVNNQRRDVAAGAAPAAARDRSGFTDADRARAMPEV